MSVWYAQDLVCGNCHHQFEAVLARGIHARRLPEVRNQIIRGELHHISCPACNAVIDAHRDLAYTDFDRHHWVHVATPSQLDDWAEVERYAVETFDRYMRGGPPAVQELARPFRVRVVFDLDELREKLVLWDADLDDGVIECVKLVCIRERPAIAAPGRRIRVRAVERDHLLMAAVEREHPRVDVARWQVPRRVVDEVARARATYEAQMPALFAPGFVSLDRYLRGE